MLKSIPYIANFSNKVLKVTYYSIHLLSFFNAAFQFISKLSKLQKYCVLFYFISFSEVYISITLLDIQQLSLSFINYAIT